jgi:hypothetical protein
MVDLPDPGGPHSIKTLGSADADNVDVDDLSVLNISSSYVISPKIGGGPDFGFKLFNNDFASIQTKIWEENIFN